MKNNRNYFSSEHRIWLDWQYLPKATGGFTDLTDDFEVAMRIPDELLATGDEYAPCHPYPETRIDKLVFSVDDLATFDQITDHVPTPSFRIDGAETYLVYLLSQAVWVGKGNYQKVENARQMVKNSLAHCFGLTEVDMVPYPDGDDITCIGLAETCDSDGVVVEGLVTWRLDTLACWQESHGFGDSLRVDNQSQKGGLATSPAKEVSSRINAAKGRHIRTLEKNLKLMRLEAMMRDCQWTDDAMAKALGYTIGTLEKMKRKADALNLTPAEVAEALAHAAFKGLDIHPLTPDGGNQLLVEPEADEPLAIEPEPLAIEPEPEADEPLAIEPEPLVDEPEPAADEPLAIEPEPLATEPLATEPEPEADEPLADGYVLPTYITQAAEYQALAAEYGEENLNEMDEREIVKLMQSKYSWKQPPAEDLADFDFDFPEPEGWTPPVELTPNQKYLADKRCRYMPERTHGITSLNRSVGL